MAFRGPGRAFSVPAYDSLEFEADQEERALSRGFEQEQAAYGRARDAAAAGERATRYRDQQDEDISRLVMTPGVRRGGSTRTRPQADSPLNVGSSESFERYGQRFSYDPDRAAEDEGRAQGIQETTANRQRFDSLKTIPGISERMASRMVYGRGQPLDDADPSALRSAIATYVAQPTRENAAEAVRHGANMNQFPDRFLPVIGDPLHGGERETGLQRGTPEYLDAIRQEDDMRTENDIRAARRRAEFSAEFRPEARTRKSKIKEKGTGRVGVLDLDTGEVEWTDATEAPAGKAPSWLDQQLEGTGGAPAATVVPSGPGGAARSATPSSRAPAPAAAGGRGGAGAAPAARTDSGAGGRTPLSPEFESELEDAYQALTAAGNRNPSRDQLRAEVAKRRQNARGAAARSPGGRP